MDIWSFVDKEDLPPSLQLLADSIGEGAVKNLVRVAHDRSVAKLYIPNRTDRHHWLRDLVGEEAFNWLVEEMGGLFLLIPSCHWALSRVRNNFILLEKKGGKSNAALAKKYNLSVGYVNKILQNGVD